MQAALRSATRRAVAISSRRGVATTTKAATATARASEDWLAEHEKAWVKAMVQKEVRGQMVAEDERRIARDRLRAAAAEVPTCRCRLPDDARWIRLWFDYTFTAMQGFVLGAGFGIMLYGR